MVESDRTTKFSITLYKSQAKTLEKWFRKQKNFRSVSSFYQHLTDEFFKYDKRKLFQKILLYLGYPVIIMSLMLYVAYTTDGVNQKLLEEGIYFDSLTNLANNFFIIGFSFLGWTIASFYLFSQSIKGDRKRNG